MREAIATKEGVSIVKNLPRLLRLLRSHWLTVLAAAGGMVIGTALDAVPPLLTRRIIDNGIAKGNLGLILTMIAAYIGIWVIRGVFNFSQWYYAELVGQKVTYDLRQKLHDHLQELSHSFYAKAQTGQLMSKLTGDVECIQNFLGWSALLLSNNVVILIAYTGILLSISWRLTLASLVTYPFLGYTVVRFDKRIRPAWEKVREQMGKLTTVLQENVSGVRVVKAFARENYEVNKFNAKNKEHLQGNLDRAEIEAQTNPTMELLSGLSIVLFLYFGGREVIASRLTLGDLFAFQMYLWMLIWPVRMLGWLINMMERALAAAPRLWEILDAKPEIADTAASADLTKMEGHIRFENVSFRFDDGNEDVLSEINLDIKPGETIAILGGTGSGKSTFINLIPRFYDPTAGRITIDGVDIRQISLASLRRQIGLVLQETFLFSASVGDNIAYGRPHASEEEVQAAASASQAAQFISKLPKGFRTRVGERGVGLSGGQKQRVALARALLMNPKILILDEATSSVDTETEFLIQEALDGIMKDRTTLIIAKRLSTVKGADRVVILDGGRIAEMGTHQELLAQGGIYKRLFDGQFAERDSAD